ncbi:MAG: tetratricopeptide repeat protein [Planctomycetes bacterium]|nr:tetratricopeptide repeat protein [Planctomycetota bacterium]
MDAKDCEGFEDLLVLHGYGELDAQEGARLEAHLKDCPRCASAREDLRRVGQALDTVPVPMPPPERWDGLAAQVLALAAVPAGRRRGSISSLARPGLVRAAAVLLLVAGALAVAAGLLGHRETAFDAYAQAIRARNDGLLERLATEFPDSDLARVARDLSPRRMDAADPGPPLPRDHVVVHWETAASYLRQRIDLSPSPGDRFHLAEIYLAKQDRPEALEEYRAVLRDYPDSQFAMLAGLRIEQLAQ